MSRLAVLSLRAACELVMEAKLDALMVEVCESRKELLELRPCGCILSKEMMRIRITGSKANQLRQGDEVVVARTGSRSCPVAMLEHFMAVNNMSPDDQRYIFRPLQRTKNVESLRETGWISDTCLRDLFN